MANAASPFVWHDLITTDTDAAAKFYDKVAGWGTQAWEGSTPYTMWTNSGVPIGGMVALSDEMRKNGTQPGWIASVGVDNVDTTAAKAAELGGSVIAPPSDIPGAGRYAIISDPQGATIAIFQPSGEMASPTPAPDNGSFSWHELTTTDHVAAFDFYSKLFGWEKTAEHDMGPMGVYLMYGQGGVPYGGMFTKGPDMPVPTSWLCYIKVDDAKTSAETVKSAGGQVKNGPMEVPTGDWIAVCTDPQGATFAVHSLKS